MQQLQEIQVQSLSQEDTVEKKMTTHSSILVWRIPMHREAWQATAHGVAKSDMTEHTHIARKEQVMQLVATFSWLHQW